MNEARTLYTLEYQRAFTAIKAPETTALMGEYLAEEHFGELAARVLAVQWSEANEPRNDTKFLGGVDFTHVEARRAARAANPSESSTEADMIFGVVDTLIADGATEQQKNARGDPWNHRRGAATWPAQHNNSKSHRSCTEASSRKLAFITRSVGRGCRNRAHSGWNCRDVRSGQERDVDSRIKATLTSFAHGYASCRSQPLFQNCPLSCGGMPDAWRNPNLLEDVIRGLGNSPSPDAEAVLFKLAEDDPRFYLDRQWRATVLRLGTVSSARRLVDLTASGALSGKSTDDWHWRRELGSLLSEFPEVRAHAQELLKDGPTSEHLAFLAHAVAERPGADGLLMLIDLELKTGRSFLTRQSIESVVIEHVPAENWKGAYNAVPVPAIELRQKLLAMTASGGANDPAARCLNFIDKLRDDYGAPETEPRHPDLASGRQWPMILPDPEARVGAEPPD